MYRTFKFVFAAAFAMVLFVGASQAADGLFMPYDNSQSPDGRNEIIGGAPHNAGVSRQQALEYAMPVTDASDARTKVWDQPEMHSRGRVSDPSLAMPYKGGMNDGRNQSVVEE